MALKDIRSTSAQWTEKPSPDVALPPPVVPQTYASISASLATLLGTLEGETT